MSDKIKNNSRPILNLKKALQSSTLVGLLSPAILMGYVPRARASCGTTGTDPYMPSTGDTVTCSNLSAPITAAAGQSNITINLTGGVNESVFAYAANTHVNITNSGAYYPVYLGGDGGSTLTLNNSYFSNSSQTSVQIVSSSGNSLIMNGSSAIKQYGAHDGVHVNGGVGNIITLNSGGAYITTYDNNSNAISVGGSATGTAITLQNGANLQTNGNNSSGIVLNGASSGAIVNVKTSASISTEGTNSYGVKIDNSSGNTVNLYSTYITTDGTGADAIKINNSDNNNINFEGSAYVSTSHGNGVYLNAASGNHITLNGSSNINNVGDAAIKLKNSDGNYITLNDNSYMAAGGTNTIYLDGSDSNTINLNSNSYINESASNHNAIYLHNSDSNQVTLNGGYIYESGNSSTGVRLSGTSAMRNAVTLQNGSSIYADIAIYNDTNSTLDLFLDGRFGGVFLYGTSGTDIDINHGTVNLTMQGDVKLYSDTVVHNNGVLNTILNDANVYFYGGLNKFENNGTFQMYGDNTLRGYGKIYSGNMNFADNNSSILIQDYSYLYSDGAQGINTNSHNHEAITLTGYGKIKLQDDGLNGITLNGGDHDTVMLNQNSQINSNGYDNIKGISAVSSGNNTISLNGESLIRLTGNTSTGIDLSSSDNNSVTLNDSGYILSNGTGNKGINLATSTGNTITLNSSTNNYNSLGMHGANSTGIGLTGSASNTIIMNNYGSIQLGGASSTGIDLSGSDSNTITMNGDSYISANTASSKGINLSNSTGNTITLNGGNIDMGVASGSVGINVGTGTTSNTVIIENGSYIVGNTAINATGASQMHITLDGTSDDVYVTGHSGTSIQLGSAADTLDITGVVAIDGDVNAGTGTDTLNINSTTLTLATGTNISGFETVNITGTSHVDGDLDLGTATITSATNSSLHVDGNFTASSFTVGSNAEFGGNNTFTGDLLIGNNGRLAPGNSIGTINIVGDLTFLTGSIFNVEVSGATADQVNVDGNIFINSGSTLNIIPLTTFSGSADILTATGTITGNFSTINYNGTTVTVLYNPASVSLTTSVVGVLSYNPSALNEQAEASLDSAFLFSDVMTDQSAQGAFEKDKYQWAKAVYRNTRRSDDGYLDSTDSITGLAYGAEYTAAENWKIGFSLADMENISSVQYQTSSADSNGAFASIYGTRVIPLKGMDAFATLGAIGGYQMSENKRMVNNSGVTSDAKSDNDNTQLGGIFQLGLKKNINDTWALIPKASVAYINSSVDGYTEKNGGAGAVTIDDYNFDTLKTTEGFSLYNHKGYSIFNSVVVRPKVDLSLSQEHPLDNRDVSGTFSSGTHFTTNLSNEDRNFVNTGFGFDFDVAKDVTAFINYQNAYSDVEKRNDARLGVNIKF